MVVRHAAEHRVERKVASGPELCSAACQQACPCVRVRVLEADALEAVLESDCGAIAVWRGKADSDA